MEIEFTYVMYVYIFIYILRQTSLS